MKRAVRRLLAIAGATTFIVPVAVASQPASHVEAASASVTCTPQPVGGVAVTPALVSYTAINPARLVDTRSAIGGFQGPIERGCTIRVSVGSDVPASAQAVALSMTAVSLEADYFTVYPCAAGLPQTSNLNSRAGVPTPNLVVAIPDANREICVFSHGRSDLIIDLAGWWSDGPDRFASIEPERVYDTRRPGFTPLAAFRVREVVIPATTIAADATAAVINLTTTGSTRGGYMAAFPCGKPAPPSSNLNWIAGEDRAVGAIVGLGLGRTLCLISEVPTNVVVDVTGYYAPAPAFSPSASLQPDSGRRVVDTRNGIGGPRAAFAAGEIRSFDPVAGLANADDASAVMLNFISTNSTAGGYLTVFPCGDAVPYVSSLNFTARQDATNLATVKIGDGRKVCVLASAPTEVIVDVFGVMNASPGSPFERLTFDKPTWPDFDPAATDYVVECGAGAGVSNVTIGFGLMPSTGVSVSVGGGAPITAGNGNLTVPMHTDEALVVSTNRLGVRRDYHFRCVPSDFPRLDVSRPGDPTPGWYLTTFGFSSPAVGEFVTILDEHGAPVWYKRVSREIIDAKRLSDGRVAFTPTFGPFGVRAEQGYWATNLEGSATERFQTTDPVALPTDHHDFIEFPGGRTMLSYPLVPGEDLRPFGSSSDTYADGVIQELDVAGAEVWSWRTRDHFAPSSSTFPINFAVANGLPPVFDAWDVFHLNSIDRLPDGDYVVSARHLDAVFRVDRTSASGDITWTLGGPAGSPGQLTVLGDPYGGPKRPHDARMVGDVLTVFDNQASIPGRQSRAVAYRIDEAAGTATLLWEFRNPGPNPGETLGSVRRATDGSVLVNWSSGLQPIIEEFAPNGTRLMAITIPGASSYRTVKYAPGDFDVTRLRATAGGAPITLP
jgi:Arylsulfotransferase (ASST)